MPKSWSGVSPGQEKTNVLYELHKHDFYFNFIEINLDKLSNLFIYFVVLGIESRAS